MSDVQYTLPPQRNKIEIKHVQQRKDNDCVSAAIAMVCSATYEEVEEVIKSFGMEIPLTSFEECKVIAALQHLPLREVDSTLYFERCYLATVPSLNLEAHTHRVVITTYDEKIDIHDPNTGREGKKAYTNETVQSWDGVVEVIDCRV